MHNIHQILKRSNFLFVCWCMLAAFGTYFCMYAFRKPFNTGIYSGYHIGPIDYKIVLIIAQVFGYMISKFLGVKIIGGLKPRNRQKLIIRLILIAEASLLLFGLIPPPYNFPCLFINGLPLGMVWGVIFSYLEGRRFTELLSMGLSTSLIISSGFLKTIYLAIHSWFPFLSEFWLPAIIGLLFLPVFLFCVWMLSAIPPPTEKDICSRAKRLPMNHGDKKMVWKQYRMGLIGIIIVYTLLTMLRDFRDNFSVEIWNELDKNWQDNVFAITESISGLVVLVAVASLSAVKNSITGFWSVILLLFAGIALSGLSTLLFQFHYITPFWWMLLLGTGLFLAYIPIQIALFERIIAIFRVKANAGFFVYTCDSIGYLGSVGLLLYRECFDPSHSWSKVLIHFSYLETAIACVVLLLTALFFNKMIKARKAGPRCYKPAPDPSE
ncbi:hypothetical protein SAMN04487894_105190 [Niabella drilacis]|uniref:Uncharacterized protein n=2 Tax=Niabella drilacis (strain DSM 25811 / CCM 8410 / CCUG 62505 / LMG 26954 / E90) TaxID=1285928 RepID=A0A1G6R9E5_NIADE|nr:hypothetical protein SAMN04487894_105190 [Niabella drilacis]